MRSFALISGPQLSWLTFRFRAAILHIKSHHFVNVRVRLEGLKLAGPMVLGVVNIMRKHNSSNSQGLRGKSSRHNVDGLPLFIIRPGRFIVTLAQKIFTEQTAFKFHPAGSIICVCQHHHAMLGPVVRGCLLAFAKVENRFVLGQ